MYLSEYYRIYIRVSSSGGSFPTKIPSFHPPPPPKKEGERKEKEREREAGRGEREREREGVYVFCATIYLITLRFTGYQIKLHNTSV